MLLGDNDEDQEDHQFIKSRVHPTILQVQEGYGRESPDIPLSNADRRKWAKHSYRNEGKQTDGHR